MSVAEPTDNAGAWSDLCRNRIETVLPKYLPATTSSPQRLHQAMHYAVMGPGKRVRPLLVYAAAEAVGADCNAADGPAVAVELIHAYSLVHDDLPAMDDDDLRRGRPTCHRAFDEATAILAGDALQVLAFDILARESASAAAASGRLEMIALLAAASGTQGMAGGQALDLAAVGQALALEAIETMHRRKTGALIAASVMLGALCAPPLALARRRAFVAYGNALGLAFQIVDDLLDIEGDATLLGKATGADASRAKPTYPAVSGLEQARRRAAELAEEALTALAEEGRSADRMRQLVLELTDRHR